MTNPLSDLLGVTREDLAWQRDALCAQSDPDAFYPEQGGTAQPAKRVCLSCPVKDDCLDYAIAHDERYGVWGGLGERELSNLRRARRQAAQRAEDTAPDVDEDDPTADDLDDFDDFERDGGAEQ